MEQLKFSSASLPDEEKGAEGRMKQHSQKFLRKRKLLMVMPLLVLPFLTLLFWALGGGKVSDADEQQAQEGLNMQLPDASFKEDKTLDKLSYYEKASSDSAKVYELMKNDPYYRSGKETDTSILLHNDSLLIAMKRDNYNDRYLNRSANNNSIYSDPNEARVYNKLAELNQALDNAATQDTKAENKIDNRQPLNTTNINGKDVNRLEQMMQTMNQKDSEDPEMQQLNNMMDKIIDMQHPERLQEKIRQTSEVRKGQVFAVSVNNESTSVSFLNNGRNPKLNDDTSHKFNQQNNFYSLEDALALNDSQNAVEAVVHETQTIVNGSTIKFRLVNDIYINGILIPKDNFVFGTASLSGERLDININSIRYKNSLFPVALSAFDMDGLEGIYIPGAITSDVARQSADRAVQDIGFNSLTPSVGVQAASAGIEAAKTLFSKKVKLIKVTVKAGYQVLLRDEKQKQNY